MKRTFISELLYYYEPDLHVSPPINVTSLAATFITQVGFKCMVMKELLNSDFSLKKIYVDRE